MSSQRNTVPTARQVGSINWFNGEFGVISRGPVRGADPDYKAARSEVFVHHTCVKCERGALREGTGVTFTPYFNANKRRYQANDVTLLSEETDPDLIAWCMASDEVRLWGPILSRHLASLPLASAVRLAEEKIASLNQFARINVARSLPRELLCASSQLRVPLPCLEHMQVLLHLADSEGDKLSAELRREWAAVAAQASDQEVLQLLQNALGSHGQAALWAEIQRRLRANQRCSLWQVVSADVLEKLDLLTAAPAEKQLDYYLSQASTSAGAAQAAPIGRIASLLRDATPQERLGLVQRIPATVLRQPPVYALLPPPQKVEAMWAEIGNGSSSAWDTLTDHAKILCVYRAAKEGPRVALPSPAVDQSPYVRAVLRLYSAARTGGDKQSAFHDAHTLLEEEIRRVAWESTQPLILYPLLSACVPGLVTYCEAQARVRKEREGDQSEHEPELYAWCPRGGASCQPSSRGSRLLNPEAYSRRQPSDDPPAQPTYRLSYGYSRRRGRRSYDYDDRPTKEPLIGARIEADLDMSWERWRLLEFLQCLGYAPDLEGLNDLGGKLSRAAAYTLKVAGWVNRLNDIRQRLKCRLCGEMMVPDLKYARFLARYNVTVAECKAGEPHDKVYLNHCWACGDMIDSRDNPIQMPDQGEGSWKPYLCLYCGSGPRKHATFTQGDSCPKCGQRGMQFLRSKKGVRSCRDRACGHSIRLPTYQLTGPHCERCGAKTYDTGGRDRFCLSCYERVEAEKQRAASGGSSARALVAPRDPFEY